MNLIYKLVDKFLMNDFSKTISKIVNNNSKDELTVFDVGCFQGNFSRSLQKEIKKKLNTFYSTQIQIWKLVIFNIIN